MVINIKESKYNCPFCGNPIESRFSKCFNIYCQGQKFNLDNLVLFRLNNSLGIGKIIKIVSIPTSKSIDDEDTSIITKFKVLFKDNIINIVHPMDLVHYIFNVNERVILSEGVAVINSNDFLLRDGQISYEVLFQNGKKAQIYEKEILSKYETSIKKIISKGKFDPPKQFLIKYWAHLFHSYYTSYQIKCITNSRLSLMPHQINVAHRLSEEYSPRLILADEVGLGKTIEAGIFIKESIARNLAQRILIIVPATLVKQWQFELSNKFFIDFIIYDGKKVKELTNKRAVKAQETYINPFYNNNLIICSLQFARNRKYAGLISQISWDIIIFDEAHHLRRYLMNAATGNYRETLNFELARKLSTSTESILLLSATPLQLHSFELYSLIELIQRESFDNFSDFEHFRKNMPFINLLVSNLNQIDKLNKFEVQNTFKLLRDLNYIDKKESDSEVLDKLSKDSFKSTLLKRIEKDHTLSQFLIRNRKKNVFAEDLLNKRIVKTILVNPSKQEMELYKEIRLYLAKIYNSSISKENVGIGFVITTLQKLLTSSKAAFLKSLERRLEQIQRLKTISVDLDELIEEDPEFFESELEDEYLDTEFTYSFTEKNKKESKETALDLINQEKILKEFYNKLKELPYDSKIIKLIELVKQIHEQNPYEKIIIFSQFVDTVFHLKQSLESQKEKYYVEIFYGGMNKEEKDKAVERFRNHKIFSILISTEIGGEGRNFQFARVLINYDLPWNPMKLEQRIGRLDRIGQKSKEIYIYNFYLEGTIEADIVFALDKRIHLFEESIGHLEPIIGTIEKDIKAIIFTEEDGTRRKKLNEFNRKLDLEVKQAKEMEMQLDDLLIDKKSFQMDDLITSLEACQEVKLSHNELYLLTKYFFSLKNHKYGNIVNINEALKPEPKKRNNQLKIILKEDFKNNYKLLEEYIGTFNLELAREREDINFFALGHPLINAIIDFCKSTSFKGNFTILNVKKDLLPESLKKEISTYNPLYLFIFSIKFQGYILETQYSPIILDKNGNELLNLSDTLLDINNFSEFFDLTIKSEDFMSTSPKLLDYLRIKAKDRVKLKTSRWKKEIKALNEKIFEKERIKKERIYEYRKRILRLRLESLKKTLERQEKKRPTEKQLLNIEKLNDQNKKKERLEKLEELEEQIKFIRKDIKKIERLIDDLAFEYEDLLNEMKKRNLAKFYTNLSALSVIRITD
jgi:SNF2 family DNA or RNA helicase